MSNRREFKPGDRVAIRNGTSVKEGTIQQVKRSFLGRKMALITAVVKTYGPLHPGEFVSGWIPYSLIICLREELDQ